MTKILIKKLSKEVSLPKYETDGSSGMDLSANIDTTINIDPGKKEIIPLFPQNLSLNSSD